MAARHGRSTEERIVRGTFTTRVAGLRRLLLTLMVLAAAAAWTATATAATSVTIAPEADTYVTGADPTSTHGGDPFMDVYGGAFNYGCGTGPSLGLLRFDLSSLPAGATIVDASLDLTSRAGFAFDGDPEHYAVFLPDDSWNEGTVSWDTRPADGLAGNPLPLGWQLFGENVATSPFLVGRTSAFDASGCAGTTPTPRPFSSANLTARLNSELRTDPGKRVSLEVTTFACGTPFAVACQNGQLEQSYFLRYDSRESAGGTPPQLTIEYTVQPDNDVWTRALPIALNGAGDGTSTGQIDQPGQARWYRFGVTPGGRVSVDLSNLATNYDVAVFSDIGKAFRRLTTLDDLEQLSAEFAADAYSPSVFSPSVFSPSVFSPSVFSPSVFSPSVFSPSVFSPSVFSPSVFSPSVFSPVGVQPVGLLAVRVQPVRVQRRRGLRERPGAQPHGRVRPRRHRERARRGGDLEQHRRVLRAGQRSQRRLRAGRAVQRRRAPRRRQLHRRRAEHAAAALAQRPDRPPHPDPRQLRPDDGRRRPGRDAHARDELRRPERDPRRRRQPRRGQPARRLPRPAGGRARELPVREEPHGRGDPRHRPALPGPEHRAAVRGHRRRRRGRAVLPLSRHRRPRPRVRLRAAGARHERLAGQPAPGLHPLAGRLRHAHRPAAQGRDGAGARPRRRPPRRDPDGDLRPPRRVHHRHHRRRRATPDVEPGHGLRLPGRRRAVGARAARRRPGRRAPRTTS